MDDEHAFEHAYFTNSYPQETPKAKSIQSCLKVLVFITVLFEVTSMIGIGFSYVKFSQLVSRVDNVIHFGTWATLISSAAKIVSAINAHYYASNRTGRTPEKREQTGKFFRAVTFVSGLLTYFVIHLLNKHAMLTVDTLRTTFSENELQGSHDYMTLLTDSIAGVQLSLFTTFMLHLLIHFMTHRLDKVERGMPRVVDITAAKSYPKKDQ